MLTSLIICQEIWNKSNFCLLMLVVAGVQNVEAIPLLPSHVLLSY